MAKKITIDLDNITSQMDALKMEKARLSFELKAVEKEIEKLELQLVALLGQLDVKEMQHGIYSWGLKEVSRTSLDQKMLKELYPEQYNACYVQKMSEKFEFRINN